MDVFRLAEKLAAESGLDADAVYAFLMHLGREQRCNPKNLDIRAREGAVIWMSDPEHCRLEKFSPPLHRRRSSDAEADFWENRIFDRQEPFTD